MNTTKLELYDFKQYDASLRPMGTGRSSGLHLSSLVKAAVQEITGKKLESIEGEQEGVRAQMGFLWERAMEYAFTEYMNAERKGIKKQLKVELEGVTGSPDGLSVKDSVLEEYKCTWRSMRRWNEDPEGNFLYWFMQVKGYLHMLGLTKVRFFIFWVNGDYTYKPGRGPQVTTQEFEFTEEELSDNWALLIAQRGKVKEEVHEDQ
jgi:hypothetical protein